jgi:hypothetical protein
MAARLVERQDLELLGKVLLVVLAEMVLPFTHLAAAVAVRVV